MSRLRTIDFACNDPDDGSFAGKVWQAEIDDNEIEAPGLKPVAFTVLDRGSSRVIRIHRSMFRIKAEKEWLGNWCWNRFWLEQDAMHHLLRHLAYHGWRCSSGDPEFRAFMENAHAAS